jgi:hypothetical protein
LRWAGRSSFKKGAQRYGAKVEYSIGRAEFIGTQAQEGTDREQRDDARRVYEEIIGRSDVQGSQEVWARVHHRWGEALGVTTPRI